MCGTALPAAPVKQDPKQATLGKPNSNLMIEVEQLYSGRLAFILGRRAIAYDNRDVDQILGMEARQTAAQPPINSRTQHMLHQFAVGGSDQHTMQRMCSFEYLEHYFYHVLRTKTIDLGEEMYANDDAVPTKYKSAAAAVARIPFNNVDGKALIDAIAAAEQQTPDAATAAKVQASGIFANDDGPFLRGGSIMPTT